VHIGGGTWTHQANGLQHLNNPVANSVHRLRVDVGGDFMLDAGAALDVTSKGFVRGNPGGNGSASHGGIGGVGLASYGSVFEPILHGMGANSATNPPNEDGGGAIYLTVGGASTIDGALRATVINNPQTFNRAGAGGSVYLETGTLSGDGFIQAHGGNSAGGSNAGGGGGGRIAVVLNDAGADFANYSGTFDARAGTGGQNTTTFRAAGGSVYLQAGDQAAGHGDVVIDFFNINGQPGQRTHRLSTEDFTNANVSLLRNARLEVNASKVIGSLSGDASSTLVLNTSQTLTAGGLDTDSTFAGTLVGAGHLKKPGLVLWNSQA